MSNRQQQHINNNNNNHNSVCQAHYNRKFKNNSSIDLPEENSSMNNDVVWAYRPLQPESRGIRVRERKSSSIKEINQTLDWQILLPSPNLTNIKSVRFSPLRKKEPSPSPSLRKIPSSSLIYHNGGEYGDLHWNNHENQNQRLIHSPSRNMMNSKTKQTQLSLKIEKSPESRGQHMFFVDELGPASGLFVKKKSYTTSSPNIVKKISSSTDLPMSTKAKLDLLKENAFSHVEQLLKQSEVDVREMRSGRVRQSQSQARLKSILFDDLMKKSYRSREKTKKIGNIHRSKEEESIHLYKTGAMAIARKQVDRKESIWPWSEANHENNRTGDLLITKQAIHNSENTTVIQARKPIKSKKKLVCKIQTLGFDSFKDQRGIAESLSLKLSTPDKRSMKSPKFRITGHQQYVSSIDLNKTSPESAQIKTSTLVKKEIVVQGSVQIDKRSSTAPWSSASRARLKRNDKDNEIEQESIIKGHGYLPQQDLEGWIAQREKLNGERNKNEDDVEDNTLKSGKTLNKQRSSKALPDSQGLSIKHLPNDEYENTSPKYHLLEEPSPFNYRDHKSEFLEKKLIDQLGNGDLEGWEQDSNVSEVDLEAAINQKKGYPARSKQPI